MRRTLHLLEMLAAPVLGLGLVATSGVGAYGAPTAVPSSTTVSGEDFATDAAGWTASSSTSGLCVPLLLCPAVSAGHATTGGAGGAGDGYLRTSFSSLANTLLGTTAATWQSPVFRYDGIAGAQPAAVSIDLDRRAQLAALVPVDLANTSSFRVDVVDRATGVALTAVDTTALPRDTSWTAVPTVSVDPAQLRIGHDYALRITTSYSSFVTVAAAGEVGYDDVRITATPAPTQPPVVPVPPVVVYPVPTTPTTPVTPVTPAVGITSTQELRQLVRSVGLPTTARLVGNRVKIRVTCPAQAAPRSCRYALQGLSAGKGSPASTGRSQLVIEPGTTRTVRLVVRPAYAARDVAARKITIRAKVRVGVFKVTVVKRVRLRH